ncbi:MAG TPA: NTP transferase domain-containing protein [Propionibacteriaceae bacterium]|nr:NTP transferase domain-containing protein [Propionibacteriaceae bacterium]
MSAERVVAVVLAGGASRRFGSDKLAAEVGGASLLDVAVSALPAEMPVIVVGPERPTARSVTFTREQPPGGGPAAGLVAGVRAALEVIPQIIVVVPGDAPAAGRGVLTMVAALGDHQAAVGVDAAGQWQPLQLALRPAAAQQLVELAGPDGAAGQSARRLLTRLDPPPQPVTLDPAALFDIDTPDALQTWLHRGNS